jgi:hypothetical protein
VLHLPNRADQLPEAEVGLLERDLLLLDLLQLKQMQQHKLLLHQQSSGYWVHHAIAMVLCCQSTMQPFSHLAL